ncbi:MAG TPA: class I SAM-dependent methyltransferase [Candidatus Binatia bacterium]|nr:class I SAM-dependent methyltransferase [Candidatus Binatia bacterium]
MEDDRPSRTALGAAFLRAAHQVLDDPRVLDDPIAPRLLGADAEAELGADPAHFETPEMRGMRAFIALRSRYAEDHLARAVARGVRQLVVLGAGFDTFAYRNPHPELRVLEVDRPATQAAKRARLAEAGIAIPGSLAFVPLDFERETLGAGLARAGFRAHVPSFFSWLGVTVYLTRDAVMQTLRFVATETAPGSEIVFTFVEAPNPLAERTAELGERWQSYFEPAALARELAGLGFSSTEHLDPVAANRRYFGGRSDGLAVGPTGHLMSAIV